MPPAICGAIRRPACSCIGSQRGPRGHQEDVPRRAGGAGRRVRTGCDARGRARVWFEFDEIEQLAVIPLRPSGRYHLDATVGYAGELDRTVLGYTEFRTPPPVVISSALTDLATADEATLGRRGRRRGDPALTRPPTSSSTPRDSPRSALRSMLPCPIPRLAGPLPAPARRTVGARTRRSLWFARAGWCA